jgi:hypothetical protein
MATEHWSQEQLAPHLGWEAKIDLLIELLAGYTTANAFNQYCRMHPQLDRSDAAEIRRNNLRRYLELFAGARILLIGEAAGYAGCRFSGIPFTSEAHISGPEPLPWAVGLGLRRSSCRESPWDERSARIVWEALGERRDCLLWNAFPWHPCTASGPLSNRAPGRDLRDGLRILQCLLAALPRAQPVAVGRVAHSALSALGVAAPYIRHPSHGGRRIFEAGLAEL